jgi:hypothetical protein
MATPGAGAPHVSLTRTLVDDAARGNTVGFITATLTGEGYGVMDLFPTMTLSLSTGEGSPYQSNYGRINS